MGIVRPIMEVYPLAWTFFVPFIFVVTFVMINLIVAIVVDAMSIINKEEEGHIIEEVHVAENHTNTELSLLREEIAELKSLLRASVKS
jgi:voltage-gated sodium channel